MSGFTEAEIQVIAEAATLDPQAGLDRLAEVFGSGTARLLAAAAAADGLVRLARAAKLRAGEAVDLGDGQVLMRDVGVSGRVLRAKR